MSHGGSFAQSSAEMYLRQMQALTAELESAIAAIAANHLPALETSVERQRTLAAELLPLAKSAYQTADIESKRKIRMAEAELRRANLRYTALLRHAQRSAGLMASLCRSSRGEFAEARGTRPSHRTWSCVM